MTKETLPWTFGPVAAQVMFFLISARLWPASGDAADLGLLIEQLILAVAVVWVVVASGKYDLAGWRLVRDLNWLWLAGPLWLAILAPLGMAMTHVAEAPARAALWIASSIFIGLSEETIYRGFLFSGLRRGLGIVQASIFSALIFGGVHCLNALWGAGSGLVLGVMFQAFGIGLALVAVTLYSGSIWPAVLLHIAVDAVGLSAGGGYGAIVETEGLEASLYFFGAVTAAWGSFWIWRFQLRLERETQNGAVDRVGGASA